ncbi:hypothetical protein CC1G_12072 [Coprinopsis cinerea okayama7|uniref:Uncharacterized protein n=1 Tax=Coprinopsis cinerea (strain Okayama-7 / 130 / ATCC MYA-4618 / FGSC 9003) TaxID=240176 RepID=A8N0E1_COPC7|nr:hypothetical protein CC1G_12072 [Coprinopsis cinerea okayama7\|eukprot:XP_001828342.2 hypothetical protein CC1G_12072 [Coprinopsis cinerea okayama7\
MGNDGGSIPDRRDLVKTKAKAEQVDKASQTKARWFYCALSKEPIVSCALGKLYNKDAVIEYLLDKSSYGDGEEICGHIRSLKDVKQLKLTPNAAPSTSDDTDRAAFVCPLNLKEMNGSQPFVYISTCGCAFSQAGLRTVSGSPKDKEKEKEKEKSSSDSPDAPTESTLDLCPQCGTKYSRKDDIIPLNPSQDEERELRFAMERRRALEPAKKKSKKRKHDKEGNGNGEEPPAKKKQQGSGSNTPQPTINPSVGAASRAVVEGLAAEEAKRKANMSDAIKSLYGDGKPAKKETFMTMGTFTRYA